MRMGASDEDWAAGTDTHLTGEGTAGAGGRLAGESACCVAVSTGAGKFGGMRKCMWSSLQRDLQYAYTKRKHDGTRTL